MGWGYQIRLLVLGSGLHGVEFVACGLSTAVCVIPFFACFAFSTWLEDTAPKGWWATS